MTVYGPRCPVHPDRIGSPKTLPNRLLVIHTSEGSEGASSAENLCVFLQQPGDRISDSGRRYGSSYHYLIDTDRVLPAVTDNLWAFHAAGANNFSIGICIPGTAYQSRAQWLDATSRAYIHRCAEVMLDESVRHGIPLTRLSVAQVQAGQWGYCGHYDISRAYHQSDHTDPGTNFPWDVLAQDIEALILPPPPPPPQPGEDMQLHREPPRIYVTDPADKVQAITAVDPGGQFLANDVRRVRIPIPGLRQAKVQVTVRPVDAYGFLRVGPGDVDLTQGVHSNVNWAAGQAESSPVDVILDSDCLAIYASGRCHVIVDWLGWLV